MSLILIKLKFQQVFKFYFRCLWRILHFFIVLLVIIIIILSASRSEIREFKPSWSRWIFSGRKNPEYKSSGRDFKPWVPRLRFQAR